MSQARTYMLFSIDIYIEKYFKELMGNTDIKDALQNLDRLTQEEARIANAELLNIVHGVRCKVICVNESIQGISGDLQGIAQGVNDTIQSVGDRVEDVHGIFRRVDDGVQDIRNTVQGLDNRADRVDRELSSSNTIFLPTKPPQILTRQTAPGTSSNLALCYRSIH